MSRADKLLDIVFQAKNDQQGRGHHGTSSPEKLRQKVLQVLHPVSTWTCATEEIFRDTVCQELVQVSDEQFELKCNSPVNSSMGADEMAHALSSEAATGLATVVEVEE
ncbi:uncharacterized protein LOC120355723, partial [Nilaparvata lugens]|uniref:uncharacterized protein LOC120355723 n=1 Tax=Nilaparvata lugens TaxID=108931 RepID=UPI00193D1276